MTEKDLVKYRIHSVEKELTRELFAKLLAHLLHMGLHRVLLFIQLSDLLLSEDSYNELIGA